MSFVNIELTREECEAIREEDGYMRGLEDGEARGKTEGEATKQRGIARKMLSMNAEIEFISEATGLKVDEIKKLAKADE